MEELPKSLEDVIRSIATTEQRSIVEAVLNDILDAIPVVGEIAGLIRLADSIEKKDFTRALLEFGDLVLGFPPGIGDVSDILTPTNLIAYLLKKK